MFTEKLHALRVAQLDRNPMTIERIHLPFVTIDGHDVLLCNSNDYLSLSQEDEMKRAAIEAIEQFGTSSTGSRLVSGNFALHTSLERAIATWMGEESAIVFNSGYDANLALLSTVIQRDDLILSDELNHASLIDGMRMNKAQRLIYRHCDVNHLRQLLAAAPAHQTKWIVTDGVFSMDGTIAPIPALINCQREFENVRIIVDDAHAIGLLGNGRGTAHHFNERVDITVGTMSKALGATGGFVVAERSTIEWLKNKARSYIYTTALPPSVIRSVQEALTLIERQQYKIDHVLALSQYFADALRAERIAFVGGGVPIISVIIGDSATALQMQRHLFKHRIFATAIRPPTVPDGTARIRFTLTALHTYEHVDHIVRTILKKRKWCQNANIV